MSSIDRDEELTLEVVRLVRGVVGADVVGCYRHGSAVLGGLRVYSDIDLLVVVRRRLTGGERQALLERLLAVSDDPLQGGLGRPVELSVVVQAAVRPWRYPAECEFQYGEWLRAEYEGGLVPGAESCPDLAVLITMVLMGDSSVFGPAAGEVLEPVPRADLRAALLDGVPGLLGEVETDTRNVLLTFARIWSTLVTGRIWSKDEAASWALARLPVEHRAVLARARSVYLGLEEECWDGLRDAVREHVGYVHRQIRAVSGSGVGYSG